nr:hypothetical protein [Nocardia sp. BMG111209]
MRRPEVGCQNVLDPMHRRIQMVTVGQERAHRRGGSVAAHEHHELTRDRRGQRRSVPQLQQRQRQIDTGGDSRAGTHPPVVDEQHIVDHLRGRIPLPHRGEHTPMTGAGPSVEQPRLTEHERAGADRRQMRTRAEGGPHPVEHLRRDRSGIRGAIAAEVRTGDHHQIVGADRHELPEPAQPEPLRADRRALPADETQRVIRTRMRRGREHLRGTGQIQQVDLRQNQEHDVHTLDRIQRERSR